MAFSIALNVVSAALRERTSTGGKLGGDSRVGINPVGECILAILDDGLASLISIICGTSLAWGDWVVINELQKVLSETSNDCEFLTVFTESIKLVGVSSLKLFAGDVGELSLSDKRFGLRTDKLLLENNNLG